MGKPQKHKSNYRSSHGGKRARYGSQLGAGMRGILITCNKRERESVREAYNLLNEYADKLYGPEKVADNEGVKDSSDEEDIEAALKREVDSLQHAKLTQQRFQQVDTGTTNVVFIRTSLEDPTELVRTIFMDTLQSQQSHTRYILRMYPVLGTCSAYDDRITAMATKVLEGIFCHGQPTTYASQIKVRNNTGMSRTSLLPVLGKVMEDLNPNATVDFAAPEFIVNVDVLKTVACIGCLRDFKKFRKYNIQEVVNVNRTVNDVGNSNIREGAVDGEMTTEETADVENEMEEDKEIEVTEEGAKEIKEGIRDRVKDIKGVEENEIDAIGEVGKQIEETSGGGKPIQEIPQDGKQIEEIPRDRKQILEIPQDGKQIEEITEGGKQIEETTEIEGGKQVEEALRGEKQIEEIPQD